MVTSKRRAGKIAVSDPFASPRAANGRAPDVFRPGARVPMREYPESEEVDFVIVGTGAGGGTLARKLAEYGFSIVALDAGPYFRPLEDFASDESEQTKLYWTDDRIVDGDNPLQMGSNNTGKAVGGSTVHFAMLSLRFRPEWFKSRSVLGYGADWPIDWREMWNYYAEVEQVLKISGPVNYPWGPPRPRYPYRAHELNAARALAKGCEALGVKRTETPLATLSAPRGLAHPCVYRGFCVTGCSTNAKQSALVTWLPRAITAGAEIRHREGRWRFQRARNVVIAGYAIETPRLLLNSARDRFPDGLANSSGLVHKKPNGAIESSSVGCPRRRGPRLQGAAVARHYRALELRGQEQRFFRRLCLHEPRSPATALGQHTDERARFVGCAPRQRNAEL
jgi:choline dehydrogenase-like flavoprotein